MTYLDQSEPGAVFPNMRETTLHLNRKIEDLEDVRTAMGSLR